MKRIITIFITLLAIGFVAYKLYSNKEKNAKEVAIVAEKNAQVAVRSIRVGTEKISDLLTSNGTFEAVQDLNVSSEIGGQVVKIFVKEGDWVTAGQILAQTKADQPSVQFENAKSVLENAKNEVKRFESAYQTGGVTAQQLEMIRLQLKNAQANYNNASIISGNTAVRSKISGIVSSKNVEEGTMVAAGTPLFNIVNINELKFRTTIDETRVAKLKLGDLVKISPSALNDQIDGKITFIAPKSDGAMKFPVEILVSNKDNKLKAGMYATAHFSSNNGENVSSVVVPRTAFVGSVSQNKIFKIVDGKAQLVNVKSGRNFGDKVAIESGLSEGDEIVISGQINLDNGTPVKVIQ